MLFFGILIMVLGTYANLYGMDDRLNNVSVINKQELDIPKVIDIPNTTKVSALPKIIEPKLPKTLEKAPEPIKQPNIGAEILRREPLQQAAPLLDSNIKVNKNVEAPLKKTQDVHKAGQSNLAIGDVKDEIKLPEIKESRREPPQPQESLDLKIENKSHEDDTKVVSEQPPQEVKIDISEDKKSDVQLQQMEVRHEPPQPLAPIETKIDTKVKKSDNLAILIETPKIPDPVIQSAQVEPQESLIIKPAQVEQPIKKPINIPATPETDKQVDIEAIKKEDSELLQQEKEQLTEEEKKNLELLKTLEKQNIEQQKLVEESKKVLEEFKQRQHVLEEKKQKVLEKEKQGQMKKDVEVKNVQIENHSDEKHTDILKLNKGNLLPLPIALSNAHHKKTQENVKETEKSLSDAHNKETQGKVNESEKSKQDNDAPQMNDIPKASELEKDQGINKNEPPILHREIRSANANADKECEKKSEVVRPDEPVIKMDMKLSDPAIVNVKDGLNDVNVKIDPDIIKPLSRDLNSM